MKKLPEVNQLVATSNEPDATIYRVKEHRSKFSVGIVDAKLDAELFSKGEKLQPHYVDISILCNLSNLQLKQFNKSE